MDGMSGANECQGRAGSPRAPLSQNPSDRLRRKGAPQRCLEGALPMRSASVLTGRPTPGNVCAVPGGPGWQVWGPGWRVWTGY